MSFLRDLKVRLLCSKSAHDATAEILSLLKESGLNKIPFLVEFIGDDRIAITMIRDADDPRMYDPPPEEESDALAIASIFGNALVQRWLMFAPGTTFDFGFQHGY